MVSEDDAGLREEARTQKRTKFGGFKYVHPKDAMREMRDFFEETMLVIPADPNLSSSKRLSRASISIDMLACHLKPRAM